MTKLPVRIGYLELYETQCLEMIICLLMITRRTEGTFAKLSEFQYNQPRYAELKRIKQPCKYAQKNLTKILTL